jgi:hypothetical protein
MEMEKVMFLFPRKEGLTREEFFDHYLQVHAPLGLAVTRTMRHYAVNLHDGVDRAPEGVDAVTETWVDSIAAFFDPAQSFASTDDAQRLMADHESFIGDPYFAYAVEEHTAKGRGEPRAPAPGPTPGSKVIVHVSDADARAQVVQAAVASDVVTDVVENRVVSSVMPGGPAADAFVSVWSTVPVVDELQSVVGDAGAVYSVSEHVRK